MKYHEILAVDPGTHMGWARFIDGIMKEFGTQHRSEEIYPWIGKQRPDLWVIEDYIIRDKQHGGFDHQFQHVYPAKVIGAIEFFAYNCGVDVILQQPSIKQAASRMMTGKPYVKQNNRHHWDAMLHGGYFIKRNGLTFD